MKKQGLRLAAAVTTSIAASTVLLTAGVAAGSGTAPPWEPDSTNEVGTISFYDSSGVQVTSGNVTDAPFASYAVGTAIPHSGDTQALLLGSQPNPNNDPAAWNSDFITGAPTTFPLTTGPDNIKTLSQTGPVAQIAPDDLKLSQFATEYPNGDTSGPGCAYAASASGCTNTDYQNIYQLRLITSDGSNNSSSYDVADILVTNPQYTKGSLTGGQWQQIYPTVNSNVVGTTTTVEASPTSPVDQGTPVTLTATVTADDASKPAGTVQFTVNGSNFGAPVTVDTSGTNATATLTTSDLPPGTDTIGAAFSPQNPSAYQGSSATTTVSYTVNPIAAKPTVTGSSRVGTTDTCSATTASGETATYKWLLGGAQVATGKSYKIPAAAVGKQLGCSLTVQIGTGPANTARSATVKVLPGILKNTGKPKLSGKGRVGSTVKVSAGRWSPAASSYHYQWLLNGKAIRHATKSSYRIPAADRGKKLSCRVTAEKTGYSAATATSGSIKVKS